MDERLVSNRKSAAAAAAAGHHAPAADAADHHAAADQQQQQQQQQSLYATEAGFSACPMIEGRWHLVFVRLTLEAVEPWPVVGL